MYDYMDVEKFIREQNEGIIFCKITKSTGCEGKGSYVNYSEKEGEYLLDKNCKMTFEPLEIVLRYLHYGDTLTIIKFNEKDLNELKEAKIMKNGGNNGCYNTTKYKVGKSMSLKEIETYDYIFNNAKNIELFKSTLKDNYNIIISRIEEYGNTEKTLAYFRSRTAEYLQEEPIPEVLLKMFDSNEISGQGLIDLFNELKKYNINIYLKDIDFGTYTILTEENFDVIMEKLRIQVIRGMIQEFFVDSNDMERANKIKTNIFEPSTNILSKFINKLLNKQ